MLRIQDKNISQSHSLCWARKRPRTGATGCWLEVSPTAAPRSDDIASLIDRTLALVPEDDDLLRMRKRRRLDAEAPRSPEADDEGESDIDSPANVASDGYSFADVAGGIDAVGTRKSSRTRKSPNYYVPDTFRQSEHDRAGKRKYGQSEHGRAVMKKYEQSEHGRAVRRKYLRKYLQSEHGRAVRRKYAQSDARKAVMKKDAQSDAGKASTRKYRQSEHGRAVRRKYAQSAAGKAAERKYKQSEHGRAARRKYAQSAAGKACENEYKAQRDMVNDMVNGALVVEPRVQRGLRNIPKQDLITHEKIQASVSRMPHDPSFATLRDAARQSVHHIGNASARVNIDDIIRNILDQTVDDTLRKFTSIGQFSDRLRKSKIGSLLTNGRYAVYVGFTTLPLHKEAFAFVNRSGAKHGTGTRYGSSVLEYMERPQGRTHSRPFVTEAQGKLGFVSFAVGTFDDATTALNVEAALQAHVSRTTSKSRFLGIRLFRELTKLPSVYPATLDRPDRLPTVFVTVAEINLGASTLSNRRQEPTINLNGIAMRVIK